MKSFLRWTLAALLATGPVALPATEVQAVSWGNILRGAINVGSTHAAVDAMDRDQDGMLRETQDRTGVYKNDAYQQRAKTILQRLQDTGIPSGNMSSTSILRTTSTPFVPWPVSFPSTKA